MIGLDANVLVRYLTQDDPVQAKVASTLIQSLTTGCPGFVTQVALVQIVWVLGRAYGAGREKISRVVETMLRTKEIVVESTEVVWRAWRLYVNSYVDFADCLIEQMCRLVQCDYTATFDAKAAKTTGMRLIA